MKWWEHKEGEDLDNKARSQRQLAFFNRFYRDPEGHAVLTEMRWMKDRLGLDDKYTGSEQAIACKALDDFMMMIRAAAGVEDEFAVVQAEAIAARASIKHAEENTGQEIEGFDNQG